MHLAHFGNLPELTFCTLPELRAGAQSTLAEHIGRARWPSTLATYPRLCWPSTLAEQIRAELAQSKVKVNIVYHRVLALGSGGMNIE